MLPSWKWITMFPESLFTLQQIKSCGSIVAGPGWPNWIYLFSRLTTCALPFSVGRFANAWLCFCTSICRCHKRWPFAKTMRFPILTFHFRVFQSDQYEMAIPNNPNSYATNRLCEIFMVKLLISIVNTLKTEYRVADGMYNNRHVHIIISIYLYGHKMYVLNF